MLSLAAKVTLSLWAGALAVEDWRHRRLPNAWLAVGVAFGALHWLLWVRMPFGVTFGNALLAAVVALLCFVPLYVSGWMGAGDVKFLAVIGWLGGLPLLADTVLYGSLLAGGFALLAIRAARRKTGWAVVPAGLRRQLPYGTCLGVALLLLLWWQGLGVWSG